MVRKISGLRLGGALLCMAALVALTLAQPALAGLETITVIPAENSGDQVNPAAASLADGGFVVAWVDRGDGPVSVRFQRFDSGGGEQGDQITVAQVSEARRVAVAGLADGRIAVAWDVRVNDTNLYDINAQVFDSGGGAVSGVFWPGTTVENDYMPSVGALSSGDFVVAWTQAPSGGARTGVIKARRYSSGGDAKSDAFQVNSGSCDSQSTSSVVGLDNEEYVIVWDTVNWGVTGWDVVGQKFDSSNNKSGSFNGSAEQLNMQWYPTATRLTAGRFLVVWTYVGSDKATQVKGRIFDFDCNAVCDDMSLSGSAPYARSQIGACGLEDGGFGLAWDSVNAEGNRDVLAQRYDSVGGRVNDETRLSYSADTQTNPVAVKAGDGFVVIYQSGGEDGSGFGIFGRRF